MTKKSENKKKVLFKTKTIVDEKEFMKFQKFYSNQFQSNSWWPKIGMILLAVLAIILNWIKGNIMVVITLIIACLIYPLVLTISVKWHIKKRYSTFKRMNVIEEDISFYDDYLQFESRINCFDVKYDDVYVVCETKYNFYLFISSNKTFIIIKDKLDDVDKFREFIKKKTTYRRYR